MTIYRPELVTGDRVPMVVTHPKHLTPAKGGVIAQGEAISLMGEKIGAEAVIRAGTFEDTMLRALDKVSGAQNFASNLIQTAITDPDSVDAQDITIAQAKANMSLDITRTVLNRIVQGWKELINAR
ncbi:MAG: flagellar hook-basal body complex protein FliE [Treponema sp.]|nr:flagellar hook-basal body complex protein FliE [Treponema sp.]